MGQTPSRTGNGAGRGYLPDQVHELLDGEPRLADHRPQRALGKRLVIGNSQPPVGRQVVAEDDVASRPMVFFVPQALESPHNLSPR